MKVGSMEWRYDRCVVCMECFGKIDVETVILESVVIEGRCSTRVKRGMLRWFGYSERINESRLTKQIYKANVCEMERSARVALENPIQTISVHIKKRAKFQAPEIDELA
ncbi:hypothetical protein EVAR_38692_1 [Eumeta japonica]|uniref:Uncharacterized protein n=1 Tax=Eumeta variegata TaxID=151549 RepID=A0A4C1XPS5_EUMVA|nr:hypothetical protein EVAR_38692_1 [Eumeta japonica]